MYWVDDRIPNERSRTAVRLVRYSGEMRSALLNMAGTILATAGWSSRCSPCAFDRGGQYGCACCAFSWAIAPPSSYWHVRGTFVYCMAGALSIPSVPRSLKDLN